MFEVDPKQFVGFNGEDLVQLLRRLIHAEAVKAGVPLKGASVPLQITVADGGEDARVEWDDGNDRTDYFPSRFSVFQCKLKDSGDSKWKAEVWTKKSQNKKAKVVNEAVQRTLDHGGAYIGVTATPLVGDKLAERTRAIKLGIREAGGDPSKLSTVELYDGNKLAAWASQHPPVALWLKQRTADMSLASFSSLEHWGRRLDIADPPFVASARRRFSIRSEPSDDGLDFERFVGRLVDHLAEPGHAVRVTGASGLGKSRAVYEALSAAITTGTAGAVTAFATVFCDYREVSSRLPDVINSLIKQAAHTLLVIDECPFEEAKQYNNLAAGDGSRLRVLTLGTDSRRLDTPNCLTIEPRPADEETIRGIIASYLGKTAKEADIGYISAFCDGFPRIAVLAGRSYKGDSTAVLRSADDVAERILAGARLTDREQVRALATLSLFGELRPERPTEPFDAAAQSLGAMAPELLYEHLMTAKAEGLVGQYGGALVAQPRPIANYLALKRLEQIRTKTYAKFLEAADPAVQRSMLNRWRYLARSESLRDYAQARLNGGFGTVLDATFTHEGGQFVDASVHVAPATTGGLLSFALQQTSIEDLAGRLDQANGALDALERLVFGRDAFPDAARGLFRLAAADLGARPVGGRPTELLQRLYHRVLSGTEAEPATRFSVLDEIIVQDDPRLQRACLRALSGALNVRDFIREGGFESLGDQPPKTDWTPQTVEEAVGFHREGLIRLRARWDAWPVHRSEIEAILVERLRELLNAQLFELLAAFVDAVVAANGQWLDAAKAIGDWLYFDRGDPKGAFALRVRELYDRTLPNGTLERLLLYCSYWPADIRDPDARYSDDASARDYDFSNRASANLAPQVAADPKLLEAALEAMASRTMNSPYGFVAALAPNLAEPTKSLAKALEVLDASNHKEGSGFVRALLGALENAFPEQAQDLFAQAQASTTFTANPIQVFFAMARNDERVRQVAAAVREHNVWPMDTVALSYGRALEKVSTAALSDLVDALLERPDDRGPWAAVELLSTLKFGAENVTDDEAMVIRGAVLAAASPTSNPQGHMSGFALKTLVELLGKFDFIDAEFAEAFATGVVTLCERMDANAFYAVNEAYQTAIKIILGVEPEPAWRVLTDFYLVATRLERDRLAKIIARQQGFEEWSRWDAGPMFAAPEPMALAWAVEDPARRIAFLVSYYPLLNNDPADLRWNEHLQRLADQFGALPEFKTALRARLFSGTFVGAGDLEFEVLRAPLESWHDHPVLAPWAKEQLSVIRRITDHQA